MRRVEHSLFRTGRDLKVGDKMKHMMTKTAEENVKVKLDFYSYFNKDDRFLLNFDDVNILTDSGLSVSDLDFSSNRYVEFKISGGIFDDNYDVDVIVMLSDKQVWKARLSLYIGFESGYIN